MAAKGTPAGKIRIGVGGWTYEPWRGGAFFPEGLSQARELQYAGSKLTSIEINGTYYGSQKPASFMKWRDETPDDFMFSVKGPRFATNRRVLAEAGESIERFFRSGVTELKAKLGPVNWQFATTKRFDAEDFAAFLKLLPKSVDGPMASPSVTWSRSATTVSNIPTSSRLRATTESPWRSPATPTIRRSPT
jgi:uncharacterized protein YecE (DUF72 family)